VLPPAAYHARMSDSGPDEPVDTPFRYHLELTPAQLKITYTALHSLLNDFGHEESDVLGVIREVLDKLPDEHAIRAIQLDRELTRKLEGRPGVQELPSGDDTTPPAA
jgi:hypothetical protein